MHHAATFSFSQSEKRYRATSRRIPVPMRASSRFPETFSAKQTNKQTECLLFGSVFIPVLNTFELLFGLA